MDPGLRLEKLEEVNNEMNNALKSKKKRKLSIDITDTDDENNKMANKKIKLEPEVAEVKEMPKGATRRQLDVMMRQEENVSMSAVTSPTSRAGSTMAAV